MSTERARIKNHPTNRLADLTVEPMTYSGGSKLGLMLSLRQRETPEAMRHRTDKSVINMDVFQLEQLEQLIQSLRAEFPEAFARNEQARIDHEERERVLKIEAINRQIMEVTNDPTQLLKV